jgi:hypothetical protein
MLIIMYGIALIGVFTALIGLLVAIEVLRK